MFAGIECRQVEISGTLPPDDSFKRTVPFYCKREGVNLWVGTLHGRLTWRSPYVQRNQTYFTRMFVVKNDKSLRQLVLALELYFSSVILGDYATYK